jgi:ectoine hydroxylase
MASFTNQQFKQYRSDGFIIVKNLFDKKEIKLLNKTAHADKALDDHAYGRDDGEGGRTRLSLWNHPGDNIYGTFARCSRIVESAEQLLAGEVYHYHSKMILKDAKVGGAWAWHQDYGYWYQNGVLFPDLVSVMIAVDPATKNNGCLQVLKGSHKLGRVDHVLTGDQAGADMERVEEMKKRLDLVYVELDPGDAVFFHANILHRSDQNKSNHSRWTLICCYNAARNDPYKDSHHPRFTKLHKVDDSMIKKIGTKRFENNNSEWLDPGKDASAQSLKSSS